MAIGGVVVAVAVAIAITRSDTSSDSRSAAGPVSTNVVRAGNLGDASDEQALREKVEPALTARASITPTTTSKAAPSRCEPQARALQPAGAMLVYEATARWQGTPADVIGFSPPGAPKTTVPDRRPPTRVYVLARSDCRLLVFQSYAP